MNATSSETNNMLQDSIIIIPFYNRINNFTYNVVFCKENNLPLYPIIDFPKRDKDFAVNFAKYKRAVNLVNSLGYKEFYAATRNQGKVHFVINEGVKLLSKYKYVVIFEDDYLFTKRFVSFCEKVIKEKEFKIGSGQNIFDAKTLPLYTKSLISLPAGVHIYDTNYILTALTSDIKIDISCLPDFINEPFRTNIFNTLIQLYPNNYNIFNTSTGEKVIMYDKSSELKIFFYNLINKIYTFIPRENLTPHNPEDMERNIPLLVKYLNNTSSYSYIEYIPQEDYFRFELLYKQLYV